MSDNPQLPEQPSPEHIEPGHIAPENITPEQPVSLQPPPLPQLNDLPTTINIACNLLQNVSRGMVLNYNGHPFALGQMMTFGLLINGHVEGDMTMREFLNMCATITSIQPPEALPVPMENETPALEEFPAIEEKKPKKRHVKKSTENNDPQE